MKKSYLQRLVAISIVASLMLIPASEAAKTVAAEEPKLDTDSVNEVGMRVVFHFRDGNEQVETFKVFKPFAIATSQAAASSTRTSTTSGFDPTLQYPKFVLEKVVGWDTPILYKAVDVTHKQGKTSQHEFQEFDMDVTWQRGEKPFRTHYYADCNVADYYIYTDYDKEETYNLKTDFVYLDSFTFECRGVDYGNPVYNQMLADKVAEEKDRLAAQKNGH